MSREKRNEEGPVRPAIRYQSMKEAARRFREYKVQRQEEKERHPDKKDLKPFL